MKTITRSIQALFLALSLAAAAPACVGAPDDATLPFPADGGAVDSRVTAEEARALAQRTLEALNEGRYAGFSERWEAAMRQGINEEAFNRFRAQVLADHGRFQSILDARATPGSDPRNVRFTFLCQFERRTLAYYLAFRRDGTEVVGVQLAPTMTP